MSSFDVGQEHLFTIFEMAPGEGGIPGGMGMSESTGGMDDFNFTDDMDTGATAEYGVDENVLDLSDAEAEGFGIGPVSDPMNADAFDDSGIGDTPSGGGSDLDDFNLDTPDDLAETTSAETPEIEVEAEDPAGIDFGGGFDEVEGLGFGFDESPSEEASADVTPEPEVSLEPELELSEEEPSVELSEEPELDIPDEQPSLELSEELDTGESDTVEEEPSVELPDDLELPEEPELMEAPMEEYDDDMGDEEGIDFDLDSVDLDEPEAISYEEEEPEAETGGEEESFMDLEGLEMEAPEEPEDEDLTR